MLALLVKGGSSINTVGQLKDKVVSVNAPKDIGTLLIDSLLLEHGIKLNQVHFANDVPFPAVATALTARRPRQRVVRPRAVRQPRRGGEAHELADLDQGSTQDFPIQGYAVTAAWAKKYPNTLKAFTTALSQGQEIADTNRAAVETAIEPTWASRRRTRRSSRCRPSRWGLTRCDSSAW